MSETAGAQRSKKEQFRHIMRIIVIALLSIVALIFIFSNLQQTTLTFLGLIITMPGWLWFLALLAVGIVIGSLFPWGKRKHSE